MARTSKRARRTSPLNMPGAFELFKPSRDLVLKNIWIFGPLYAVPLIFGIHSWIWSPGPGQPALHWWNHSSGLTGSWPGNPLPTYDTALLIGFSVFWLLIVVILGTIASIMSQIAQLDAVEDRRLDFQDLWKTTREIGPRLLGLYIVTGLIVVGGLILLIVPGLIFIRRYFLAPYVMIDKRVSISEALSRSAELSKRNPVSVWGILGVMFLLALIGIIPIIGGLVSFAAGGLYSLAPAMRYHQLKRLA